MPADQFRKIGHSLVDTIADYLENLPSSPVTRGSSPSEIRKVLGQEGLPDQGTDPARIFDELTPKLLEHSLYTAHPRFWGYITGSPAPAGILSDLLGSSINPNVGAWPLSPIATEIELQAIRWIAEFVGYPATCGGIMVSGGNMANFIGFLAARASKAGWDVRAEGVRDGEKQLTVYASQETHTWIHKAADLFGLGVTSIRWVPTDNDLRMNMRQLKSMIADDRAKGFKPFLVVGAGGTVGTGSVDPLAEIAAICKKEDLWFHVDGAYGAPAVASGMAPRELVGLRLAHSVALDPHKWLYAPMEAGCALVRDPDALIRTFSYRPEYYRFEGTDGEPKTNLFEYGMQNSRGFRALKVWVQLKQTGREGMVAAIEEDIRLALRMSEALTAHPEFEVRTTKLSIVTFRYVPPDLREDPVANKEYLNSLNEAILDRIQQEGVVFVSNAVINGTFVMRACIVNFRTTLEDVQLLPETVAAVGREVDASMRKES